MACLSCVDKLAFKLMSHHKIDMIRAYELAEKGIERAEDRVEVQPDRIFSGTGNPGDYAKNCAGTCAQTACPNYDAGCGTTADCRTDLPCGMGTCTCPAPLANSHQISNSCVCPAAGVGACLTCFNNVCTLDHYQCVCGGTCVYDCDAGYVWNPATLVCDLIPAGGLILLKQVGVGL